MEIRDHPATIEDLEFLAEHGVGYTEAARRTGFSSTKTLDKYLRRHGHTTLIAHLVALEPRIQHGKKAAC